MADPTNVTRGASVVVVAVPLDQNGVATATFSMNLYVEYRKASVVTNETIAMTAGAGLSWSATWDSSNADEGMAYWHVRTPGPNKSAADGTFRIQANPANPSP